MPPCWHGWQYLGAEVRPSRAGALLVVQVHMVARSLHGGSSRGSLSTVHCAVTSEKGGGGHYQLVSWCPRCILWCVPEVLHRLVARWHHCL